MAKMHVVRQEQRKAQERQGQDRKVIANNKKARHDYTIEDTLEVGLVLTGTEVKALREGHASLAEAFAQITNDEVWLERAYIPEYSHGTWTNHAARRKRKLLLHRSQITKLAGRTAEHRMALVPLSLYFIGGRVKLELGVGRGNREYDKRHILREKQDRRETQRAMDVRRKRG